MRKWIIVAAVIALAGVAHANIIQNPGFETAIEMTWSAENETTNWFGWGDVEAVDSGWKVPQSGSQSLVFKNWLGTYGGLEQKSDITADTTYDFSFYSLWDSGFDGALNIQVRWIDSGGAQIGSNTLSWVMGAEDTWTLNTAQVTSMTASARAEINFDNPGGTSGALYLDTVDFAPTSIPEPSVAILGILGAGILILRKSRKS